MQFNVLTSSLVCGLLLSATSGCSSIQVGKLLGNRLEYATPENPATRMVCLWTPSEGRDLQGLPRRGMRGEIMFFTQGGDSPVAVNGDVKIYQFDNHGPRDTWNKPIHEFVFTAEQWNSFLQPGMLGPQYNLFIPYMKKHPEQVTVALQIRLTPREGASAPLYSTTSNTTLPGSFRDEDVKAFVQKKSILNGSSKEEKHNQIAQLLGTLPPRNPVDSRPPAVESLPLVQQQPVPASHTISVNKPQIETINYEIEQEQDPSEPEPRRRQFSLSPAR